MECSKFVRKARSSNNGIAFYSNKIPFIAYEAYYDESGNIKKRMVFSNINDWIKLMFKDDSKANEIFNLKYVTPINGILIFLSIPLSLFFRNFGLTLGAIYFSIFITKRLLLFLNMFYDFKINKHTRNTVTKFHSAEHMVINAYHKLQRIPTLNEVKKFSRFSKSCGSKVILSPLFTLLLFCSAMTFIWAFNSLIYIIVMFSILLFALLDDKFSIFSFLQVFVTSKPTDSELILAIEGLTYFEMMEDKVGTDKSFMDDFEIPEEIQSILNKYDDFYEENDEIFEDSSQAIGEKDEPFEEDNKFLIETNTACNESHKISNLDN